MRACPDNRHSAESEVARACDKVQEALIRLQRTPTSSSFSTSFSFSPKKLKSNLQSSPATAPSKDLATSGPVRQTPFLQTLKSQSAATALTQSAIDGSVTPIVNSCALIGRNNSEQQETYLTTCSKAQTPAAVADMDTRKRHFKMKTAENDFTTPQSHGREWTVQGRICEPDFFVFPESRSLECNNSRKTDEADGLDIPMDTDEWYSREHYDGMTQKSHVYQSSDFQNNVSGPYKNSSLQTSLSESYDSNFHKHCSVSQPSFIDQVLHTKNQDMTAISKNYVRTARDQAINFSERLSSMSALERPEHCNNSLLHHNFLPKPEKRTASVTGLKPDDTLFSSSSSSKKGFVSDCRHLSQRNHYHSTLFGQTKEMSTQEHLECSTCGFAEILDTNESDDISHYFEEDDKSYHIFTDRKPTWYMKNDGMNFAHGNMMFGSENEDCCVKTTADTNVCYVMLNESGSSMSADDMDYGCDNNNNGSLKYFGQYSHQDWDETDGKGKIPIHTQETSNKRVHALCQTSPTDTKTFRKDMHHELPETAHYLHVKTSQDQATNITNILDNLAQSLPQTLATTVTLVTLDTDTKNRTVSVSKTNPTFLSEKLNFRENSCAISPNLLEGNRVLKQLSPVRSKLQANTTYRDIIQGQGHQGVYQSNGGHQYDDMFVNRQNDESFGDEVDGLGDKKSKNPQSKKETRSKEGANESNEVKGVVSCFDGNDVVVKGNKSQKLIPEKEATNSEQFFQQREPQSTSSCTDTQPDNHSDLQIRGESELEVPQTPCKVLRPEPNYYKRKEKEINVEVKNGQGCISIEARMRRRKSDTSIGDVTETCISRSQSSPSKLGLTTDICPEKTQWIFHRPWQDQPTCGNQTLPRAQKSWTASACSSYEKRMTHPNLASLHPGNGSGNVSLLEKYVDQNIINQSCSNPKGSNEFQEDTHNLNKSLFTRMSTECNKIGLQRNVKLAEARSKRKLEFSSQNVSHQPIKRENCPVRYDMTTITGEVEGTSQGIQEGNSSSMNISYQQQVVCSRSDDEVDICVEVLDVFQETTQLRQRLDRIYQTSVRSCECSRIERNILSVALDLFRTLGNETSSRENWLGELRKSNQMIKDSLDLADNCRRLCRHGRQVTDVLTGSIIVRMKCRTLTSVVDLCHLHASGELHFIFCNILRQQMAAATPGLTLRVTLDQESVQICQDYFVTQVDKQGKSRPTIIFRSSEKVSISATVTRSTENLLNYLPVNHASPCHVMHEPISSPVSLWLPTDVNIRQRERKFSFGEVSRTAFQELNISDTSSPSSPSYSRLLREEIHQVQGRPDLSPLSSNIMSSPKLLKSPGSSPLTSPRKLKICELISEQENIDHDNN